MILGYIGISVADRELVSLAIDHVSAEHKDLPLGADRSRSQPACNPWHWTALHPLPRLQREHIHLVGDVVPCSLGTDSHERIDLNPALERCHRIKGNG